MQIIYLCVNHHEVMDGAYADYYHYVILHLLLN
jgi:hypothetical protein